MSKGLEALNSLFETMPFAFLESNTMKELKIIEKELKVLEDVEEELGIDLLKLIECIRNEKGIWKKDFNGGLINTRCMLTCYFGRWQIYDKENIYELKDYGKTWALTKEELL